MAGISFRILFVESKINEIIIEPKKVEKIKKEIDNIDKAKRTRINIDSKDEFNEYIFDNETERENENEKENDFDDRDNNNNLTQIIKHKKNDNYELNSVSEDSRAHSEIMNKGNNNNENNNNNMSPKKTALGYIRP